MSTQNNIETQINPTDDMIERNRFNRWIVAIVSPLVALAIGWIIGITIFEILRFSTSIGRVVGLAGGFWLAVVVVERSFITNGAVQAFVTIDPLRSLLGMGSALVSYGPGTHACYWWETRSSGNNVNLGAVAEPIAGIVQCADGTLTKKGDFRLRPDITRLPEFLSGVGTAASNLSGLIEARMVTYLSNKHVSEALKDLVGLNNSLKAEFVHGPNQNDDASEIEKMYGLVIADVTVSEMMPSKEVQETMGTVTEARIIAQAVRDFICSTKGIDTSQYDAAVAAGTITQAEINDTRDRIMAMSNNLQGMNLSRSQYDFNITGLGDLPKDSVAGLVAAAQAMAVMRGGTPSKGQNPRNNGRRTT